MTDQRFDLLTEPWIEVLLLDGSTETVSLIEAFTRAHQIRTVSGEVVTQGVAITRLMLAILYRALHEDARPAEVWERVWEQGCFTPDDVGPYLDKYADRFDLLSPTTPFFQVADLHTAKGEYTSLARLIADVPPKDQYFTTRAAASYATMTPAEAARWVVHAQAFDPSGIKSGSTDDDRVSGGKGYPIGVAWSGWLGVVLLEGANFFETLLLNLDLGAWTDHDSAVWEREKLTGAADGRTQPTGPADVLTWQSRRIRLFVEDGQVVGVLLCNGDALHPRNLQAYERMCAWRRSKPQEKAHNISMVLMPRTHDPERSAWRGLGSLLCVSAEGERAEGSPPGVLEWVSHLIREGVLPASFLVRARTVGVEYGSQSAVISHLVADMVALPAVVCTDHESAVLAVQGVEDAERAVRRLGDLAQHCALSAGWSPQSLTENGAAKEQARSEAFHALEKRFADWVIGFGPGMDREQARVDWQKSVAREVGARARKLVGACGPEAHKGREIGTGKSKRLVNAAIAESWFWGGLRTELPGAFEKTTGEESDD